MVATAALTALSVPAFADNVQNDVTAGGNDTFTAGDSTSVGYRIGSNNGDNQTGCNAADGTAAVVTVNVPANVTATPSTFSLTSCSNTTQQAVTFSSTVPGDHEITASVSDAGSTSTVGTYNTNPAKFTLHVLEPTATDTTAPSISYTLSPENPDGSNGWWVSPITVHWTVTDPESTITSTSGCEDSTVSDDTTGVTFTCEATSAGGTNSVTTETIKLDATNPDVSLVGGPADGESYYFGFVPDEPTCNASDATSGLADDCSVSGYDTAVGDHTVSASATDNAGNSGSDSATYHVLAWRLSGFYAPVDLHGTLNTVKGGSTVPLKFEIFAGDTELTDVDAIASFTTTKVNCDSGASTDAIETLATTGGTSLRYDTTGGQFIQNWKTPTTKGQCYRATMTTDDGSQISALFQIK